jgi:hypothetical protein
MRYLFATAALLALASPALAAERVEVTRFHSPATLAQLGPGWIEVAPVAGTDVRGLEGRAWLDAVARELAANGLGVSAPQASVTRVAEVRLTRDAIEGSEGRRGGSSVSVGVGVGSGGGWHRGGGSHVGVGVGMGFPLSGGGSRGGDVTSELSVTIRDKASGAPLWEGRSSLRTSRREADRPETAARLAHALFAGFPGKSGETIEVK